MTNYKNDLPLYAEEQIIQQKIKIPSNFIELGQPKKYWGSTEGLDKSLCQRYNFKHNDKTIVLDISQKLIEKFGLKEKEIHSFGAYINKDLLKKTPEEGGITVDKEKDIILQTEGIVLFQEKEIQVDFTSGEITDLKQKLKKSEELNQETQKLLEIIAKDNEEKHIAIIFFEAQIKDLIQRIAGLRQDLENEILSRKREESKNRELERIIKKLKEDEQVLIGLQNNFTQLQTELGNQITTLTTERERIQNELDNLRNEYRRVRWKFISSWFRKSEKSKKITDLKIKIASLNSKLFDKNQQITDLRNTINTRNQTITNLNNQVNNLTSQISSLQSEISVLRSKSVDNLRKEDVITKMYATVSFSAESSAGYYSFFRYLSSSGELDREDYMNSWGNNPLLRLEIHRRKVAIIESESERKERIGNIIKEK